jgi:mannosyltransferase OCH1-like enzyme
MKIPRIIHQTWKDLDIPQKFQQYVKGWKDHHPHWQYKLWTDKMNRDFIMEYHPDFLSTYDRYPTAIQKVDAVRYFILLKEGGLFIDLDFECFQPVDTLLDGATFVVGKEPVEHALIHGKDYILSNAFMASIPDHNFLVSLCDELRSEHYFKYRRGSGFNEILECAGPFMLSRAYASYNAKEEIDVIDCDYLFPLIKDHKTGNVNCQSLNKKNGKQAFAIHHYWGSWWRK